VPFAAQAAHPLFTEDSFMQGKGGWQFELNGDRNVARHTGDADALVNTTLTWGAIDAVDLYANANWLREAGDGAHSEGTGDTTLGFKWRVFERDGVSLALRPSLALQTGSESVRRAQDPGLYALEVVAGWTTGNWQFFGNLGAAQQYRDDYQRKAGWNAAGSAALSISDSLRIVCELVWNHNPGVVQDLRPAYATAGIVYSPSSALDLDFGLRSGLNDAAFRSSFGLGLTLHW
jgi:hypothetical protein